MQLPHDHDHFGERVQNHLQLWSTCNLSDNGYTYISTICGILLVTLAATTNYFFHKCRLQNWHDVKQAIIQIDLISCPSLTSWRFYHVSDYKNLSWFCLSCLVSLVFLLAQTFKLFGFPIFWLTSMTKTHSMNIVPFFMIIIWFSLVVT